MLTILSARRKAARIGALCLGLIGATAGSNAAAGIYTYNGNVFDSFSQREQGGGQIPGDLASIPDAYTTSMAITGSFTLDAPLTTNLTSTDISGLLQAFSFTNGRASFTQLNSTVDYFYVETDGSGNLSKWAFLISDFSASDPLGNGEIGSRIISRTHLLYASGSANVLDQGLHFLCLEAGCNAVSSADGDLETGSVSSAGTWSVTPVPLPAGAWLLLGGLGALSLRRKRSA